MRTVLVPLAVSGVLAASPVRAEEVGALRRLSLAPSLGVHHRLDDPPAFPSSRRSALGGGVEVRAGMGTRLALTLGWERFGLGAERTGITPYGSASVARRADAAWLGLRLEPWATARLAPFVGLGFGAAWQHASAIGALWSAVEPGQGIVLACGGSGAPSPALRVEAGVEAPLSGGLSVFASGGLAVFGFSDAPIGGCVSGAGSSQTIAGRIGVAYAFDLGGSGSGG